MPERGRTHGVQHATVEAESFFALVPEAFRYPLRGNSKYLLLLGAVFFMVLRALTSMPTTGFGSICRLAVALFAFGYMASFLFDVVGDSALGRLDMPGWPAMTDIHDDILVPAFCMLGTLAVCLLPAAGVWIWGHMADRNMIAIVLPLLLVGLACYPMALLGVAMTRSVRALNPLAIVAAILRVPREYATVCALFAAIVGLRYAIRYALMATMPLAGALLQTALSLYLSVVQMRLLGLLYYTKSEALGWFAVE